MTSKTTITKTTITKTAKPDWNAAPRTTWERTRIEWRNGQPVTVTSTVYTKATK
jgi:hypothetical protein